MEHSSNDFSDISSAYMANQPAVALEILSKRKNPTPQIEGIVTLLQKHIAGNNTQI